MSDRERVKDYSHYRFQLSNPCAQSFRIKRHVASGEESKQSILNFLLSLSLSVLPGEQKIQLVSYEHGERKASVDRNRVNRVHAFFETVN